MKTSLFVFALFLMVLVGCEPTSINESFLQQSILAEEDENLTKDSSEVKVDERETDDVKEKSSSSSSENVPKVVYDSKEDLPECTESLDRQLKIVEENEHAYVCSSEEWVDLGSVYESEDELPRCNDNREGKFVFLNATDAQLTCKDGEWVSADAIVVNNVEVIGGGSTPPYFSSSSEFHWDNEIPESSSSRNPSSSSIVVSSSSSAKVNVLFDCGVFDCVTTEYLNQEKLAAGEYHELLDVRDFQVYRTVDVRSLTWLAQNLNYASTGSACYGDDGANCAAFGRLYLQSDALDLCPEGWRLPNDDEWNDLLNSFAVSDLLSSGANATGLSVLLAGSSRGYMDKYAIIWSSVTLHDARFDTSGVNVYGTVSDEMASVRCVKPKD